MNGPLVEIESNVVYVHRYKQGTGVTSRGSLKLQQVALTSSSSSQKQSSSQQSTQKQQSGDSEEKKFVKLQQYNALPVPVKRGNHPTIPTTSRKYTRFC